VEKKNNHSAAVVNREHVDEEAYYLHLSNNYPISVIKQ
jgi:hypothetical protein